MIGIIDYGAGNLLSVKKAFDFLKVESRLIRSPEDFAGIERLVLPGVGAFNTSIEALKKQRLYEPIQEWVLKDQSFFGICLGLQMLFEESDEFGSSKGLAVFPGRVPQFREGKVPQIGWNQVEQSRDVPLWHGIDQNAFFYFLHGFYVEAKEPEMIIGETEYYLRYTSAVARGNVYAVQFHPEKSGTLGIQLLQNWVNLC